MFQILHVIGSPSDEFNFKPNIYYASAFDTEANNEFEHHFAIVRPQDQRWTFTMNLAQVIDLQRHTLLKTDQAEWLDLPSALQIISYKIQPTLVLPHMFCVEGITVYR